jgi:hypothetical protein
MIQSTHDIEPQEIPILRTEQLRELVAVGNHIFFFGKWRGLGNIPGAVDKIFKVNCCLDLHLGLLADLCKVKFGLLTSWFVAISRRFYTRPAWPAIELMNCSADERALWSLFVV